jgi:hypothetical protein
MNYYPGAQDDPRKEWSEADVQADREAAAAWVRALLTAIKTEVANSRRDVDG